MATRGMGGPGPGAGGPFAHLLHSHQAQDGRLVLRRLWRYLHVYRGSLWVVAGLTVVTTAMMVLGPFLLKVAIDRCIVPGRMTLLAQVVGLMIVAQLLAAGCTWLQSVIMIKVSQRAVRDLRGDLFARVQLLSLRFFDEHPHGDIQHRRHLRRRQPGPGPGGPVRIAVHAQAGAALRS